MLLFRLPFSFYSVSVSMNAFQHEMKIKGEIDMEQEELTAENCWILFFRFSNVIVRLVKHKFLINKISKHKREISLLKTCTWSFFICTQFRKDWAEAVSIEFFMREATPFIFGMSLREFPLTLAQISQPAVSFYLIALKTRSAWIFNEENHRNEVESETWITWSIILRTFLLCTLPSMMDVYINFIKRSKCL